MTGLPATIGPRKLFLNRRVRPCLMLENTAGSKGFRTGSGKKPQKPFVRFKNLSRSMPEKIPPAGDERDSKGASPFGAARAGPPAAQACPPYGRTRRAGAF